MNKAFYFIRLRVLSKVPSPSSLLSVWLPINTQQVKEWSQVKGGNQDAKKLVSPCNHRMVALRSNEDNVPSRGVLNLIILI